MTTIDHIMVPRLNWDDRRIEYQIALQKYNNGQQNSSKAACDQSIPSNNLSNLSMQFAQESQALLPKKLIVCGRYRNLDVLEQKSRPGADQEQPFVALIDLQELERGRQQSVQDLSMIKCF